MRYILTLCCTLWITPIAFSSTSTHTLAPASLTETTMTQADIIAKLKQITLQSSDQEISKIFGQIDHHTLALLIPLVHGQYSLNIQKVFLTVPGQSYPFLKEYMENAQDLNASSKNKKVINDTIKTLKEAFDAYTLSLLKQITDSSPQELQTSLETIHTECFQKKPKKKVLSQYKSHLKANSNNPSQVISAILKIITDIPHSSRQIRDAHLIEILLHYKELTLEKIMPLIDHPQISHHAPHILASMPNKSLPYVIAHADSHPSSAAAQHALAKIGTPSIKPLMEKLGQNENTAQWILDTLLTITQNDITGFVSEYSSHAHYPLIAQDIAKRTLPLLETSSSQKSAQATLKTLGIKAHLPVLEAFISAPKENQNLYSTILSSYGPGIIPHLGPCLTQKNTRKATLGFIKTIGTPSIPHLIDLTDDASLKSQIMPVLNELVKIDPQPLTERLDSGKYQTVKSLYLQSKWIKALQTLYSLHATSKEAQKIIHALLLKNISDKDESIPMFFTQFSNTIHASPELQTALIQTLYASQNQEQLIAVYQYLLKDIAQHMTNTQGPSKEHTSLLKEIFKTMLDKQSKQVKSIILATLESWDTTDTKTYKDFLMSKPNGILTGFLESHPDQFLPICTQEIQNSSYPEAIRILLLNTPQSHVKYFFRTLIQSNKSHLFNYKKLIETYPTEFVDTLFKNHQNHADLLEYLQAYINNKESNIGIHILQSYMAQADKNKLTPLIAKLIPSIFNALIDSTHTYHLQVKEWLTVIDLDLQGKYRLLRTAINFQSKDKSSLLPLIKELHDRHDMDFSQELQQLWPETHSSKQHAILKIVSRLDMSLFVNRAIAALTPIYQEPVTHMRIAIAINTGVAALKNCEPLEEILITIITHLDEEGKRNTWETIDKIIQDKPDDKNLTLILTSILNFHAFYFTKNLNTLALPPILENYNKLEEGGSVHYPLFQINRDHFTQEPLNYGYLNNQCLRAFKFHFESFQDFHILNQIYSYFNPPNHPLQIETISAEETEDLFRTNEGHFILQLPASESTYESMTSMICTLYTIIAKFYLLDHLPRPNPAITDEIIRHDLNTQILLNIIFKNILTIEEMEAFSEYRLSQELSILQKQEFFRKDFTKKFKAHNAIIEQYKGNHIVQEEIFTYLKSDLDAQRELLETQHKELLEFAKQA